MDKATALLQELVQTNTANGNEAAAAAILQREFEAAGIATKLVEYAPGRANLVAEFGDGDDLLAFTGHEDVVATGDESAWTHPPFAAEIHDGKLYGRGASDMKNGLAAMALAFIALHNSGFDHHMRFMATVGEPTGGKLIYGHSGSYNYKVKSYGKSVHSSMPATGINALEPLLDFGVTERTLFDDAPADPIIGKLEHSVTVMKAGEQVNTIPDYAELAGNIRPVPTFNNAAVTERLQQTVAALNARSAGRVEFELTHSFFPVLTPTDAKLVTATQAAVAQVSGTAPALAIIHAATDASEFTKSANHFDTIIFGHGDDTENMSHRLNEYVDLAQYQLAVQEYEAIARRYFA
ncbi:M20/M25/M40 family metallo-hydrolase [Lacticaseibacillus nasuensis]|nr:M20/M25/M40 family metallo-hydrolase [Lacticaseibacillus nasuensis]